MITYTADTVPQLLRRGADGAPAIGTPGRPWLTHAGLRALAQRTIADLNAMGIGRNDRVAMVLPNGPEMAAAFVAIACAATTAPLNPAYRADEFDFYLSDLNAKALVIQQGMESPARAVAAQRNIQLARIHEADAAWPAGPTAGNLRAVLEMVRKEHVAPALLEPNGPILVSDWGLLFRYDMQELYTELRDACGRGAHPGALCVLPADDAEQSIVLDGFNFPEFDPSRILRVPGAWLRLETAPAA